MNIPVCEYEGWFSPSTMWVLGKEFSLSGFVASPFTEAWSYSAILGAIIYVLRGDSSTHNMEFPLSWGCPKLLGWVDLSLCLANNPSLLESPEREDSLSLGFKTLPF